MTLDTILNEVGMSDYITKYVITWNIYSAIIATYFTKRQY